ncbi:MAG TPA: hypothetical protein PKE20_00355, partial [Promineifilum sp.]|nr:hypothetical protein [Promineifilum sp.]
HDAIVILAPRGERHEARWSRPATIDPRDSKRFTEGCATLLGWVLEQEGLTRREIERCWGEALPGTGHR